MRKESKWYTAKNQLNTKGTIMEKMRDIQTIRHTENKYQNDTNNLSY